jgi:hypothetical protein
MLKPSSETTETTVVESKNMVVEVHGAGNHLPFLFSV